MIRFEQPPEILVFVISRFGNHSSDKNRDSIEVSKELNVSSASYALMASIHHHGRSISSGHYTCNVFYPDTAFLCNDNQILALNNFRIQFTCFFIHVMYQVQVEFKGGNTLFTSISHASPP